MLNKENSGLPNTGRKTSVSYRSMPVWTVYMALSAGLIFSGIFTYLVTSPSIPLNNAGKVSPSELAYSNAGSSNPQLPISTINLGIDVLNQNLSNALRVRTNPEGITLSTEQNALPTVTGEPAAVTFEDIQPEVLYRGNLNPEIRKRISSIYDDPSGFEPVKRELQAPTYMACLHEMRAWDLIAKTTFAETLFFCLSAFSFLLVLRLRDNKMHLGSDGMTFPSGLLPDLNWRRKRTWTDLSAMTLSGKGSPEDPQIITLLFKSGGEASLMLNRFSAKELEQFFLALDEHAPHAVRSPELVAFRHELFSSLNKDDPSFTQLWEEELNSHFAATNFVALSPGSKLQNGKLKVIMHMSSGGLSAVYLAEKSKSMVVIKESVVPPGSSAVNREKARDMFQREASMLMKLKHPQIAKVLDHFQENERDYLLLEYIPGITLREYVRRHGPQTEERVRDWSAQIGGILKYLHEQDPPIIHRDLTPDNLMITPSGEIVLIDFGAANQFIGTATGTIVGKQFYISPEQFRGKAVPASDIYSFGGTLHYLLTGKEPEALSSSRPKSINQLVSDSMDELVADCTRLDPESRVNSADKFLQRLKATTALPSRPVEEAQKVTSSRSSASKEAKLEGVIQEESQKVSSPTPVHETNDESGTKISLKQEEKQSR